MLSDTFLIKICLANVAKSDEVIERLSFITEQKLLSVGEVVNEDVECNFITLDCTYMERTLFKLLAKGTSEDIFQNKILNRISTEIYKDKLFKTTMSNMNLSSTWSSLVYFLSKQWSNKTKRMILNHFKVQDTVDHLNDLERASIRYLGRAANSMNPYTILMTKMSSVSDDFILNERTLKTYDLAVLELQFSRLRIRGDNTAVAEMIKDNFTYRLTVNNEFQLQSSIFDAQSSISDLQNPQPDSSHRRVFGSKNEIIVYPMFLVLHLDRTMHLPCVDGTTATVRSDKDLSFPEFVTGEDLNVLDDRLCFSLLAAQTCKGEVFTREDGTWSRIRETTSVEVADKDFEKCTRDDGAETLIYVKYIF